MTTPDTDELLGYCVAFAVGLLIGVERERDKGDGPRRAAAGVRTFLLVALSGPSRSGSARSASRSRAGSWRWRRWRAIAAAAAPTPA